MLQHRNSTICAHPFPSSRRPHLKPTKVPWHPQLALPTDRLLSVRSSSQPRGSYSLSSPLCPRVYLFSLSPFSSSTCRFATGESVAGREQLSGVTQDTHSSVYAFSRKNKDAWKYLLSSTFSKLENLELGKNEAKFYNKLSLGDKIHGRRGGEAD